MKRFILLLAAIAVLSVGAFAQLQTQPLPVIGDVTGEGEVDGSPETGEIRAVRGGGFVNSALFCRLTIRGGLGPGSTLVYFGLRLAR